RAKAKKEAQQAVSSEPQNAKVEATATVATETPVETDPRKAAVAAAIARAKAKKEAQQAVSSEPQNAKVEATATVATETPVETDPRK
ncbi:electron transport complex subunit RsxC, partial [Ursidibacter maritimus]|nr:electron transport complex subunit RsxC [Ursidibacter maritimus]MBV6530538.1 electron transport complex subunit RsxC [Ursidibacter maritimus]MBV6539869.1 electron transport complex subunit RsxC [Ursidibacter maritimus]MBV6543632.1 electron transport complex subunit RsxC [Ursidibacter maritimus]